MGQSELTGINVSRNRPFKECAVDNEPITEEWLRSIGFLPDGVNNNEFAVSMDRFVEGEHTHLFICMDDMSVGVECYYDNGDSAEIVSLGYRRTREQMLLLCKALGCWTQDVDQSVDFGQPDTKRKRRDY